MIKKYRTARSLEIASFINLQFAAYKDRTLLKCSHAGHHYSDVLCSSYLVHVVVNFIVVLYFLKYGLLFVLFYACYFSGINQLKQ